MHIEIIDDNEQLALHIQKSLKKRGDTSRIFNSRDSFLHGSDFTADLYIMDINLGDGNGLDLIEHLRIIKKIINPIIIISGQTEEKIKSEGRAIGADDFIEKPFSVSELHEKIDSISSHLNIKKGEKCDCDTKVLYGCLSQEEKEKLFKK